MKKSSESETEELLNRLQSDWPYTCLNAIKYCATHNITEPEIIMVLKKLKYSSLQDWVKVADVAMATLHILKMEQYNGDNPLIFELINTNFYTACSSDGGRGEIVEEQRKLRI